MLKIEGVIRDLHKNIYKLRILYTVKEERCV